MPELPEVETIKNGLQKKIVGLTLKSITILNSKTFQTDTSNFENKKIKSVWRRAKVLGIDFESGYSLMFHLKMSGQLILDDGKRRIIGGHPTGDMRDEMPTKSTRVIFEFKNGFKLYFNDQRKFGWIKGVQTEEIEQNTNTFLSSLGPEPLNKEFTWNDLKARIMRRKNLPIKVALMDQQLISGVGNIYASEACFNAKINPVLKVCELSDKEWQQLYAGVVKALEDGIKYGGSTRAHFVNPEGEKGVFLDYANVYAREGMKCKACGNTIHQIRQAGRSTFYCPKCQRH